MKEGIDNIDTKQQDVEALLESFQKQIKTLTEDLIEKHKKEFEVQKKIYEE